MNLDTRHLRRSRDDPPCRPTHLRQGAEASVKKEEDEPDGRQASVKHGELRWEVVLACRLASLNENPINLAKGRRRILKGNEVTLVPSALVFTAACKGACRRGGDSY